VRALGRVPAPLAALLAATALLGIAWALVVPVAQSPDEPSHFAYAQVLAERGKRPLPDDTRRRQTTQSTEQQLARERSHQEWVFAEPRVRPEWRTRVFRRWQAEHARLPASAREDGGGPNSASGNPPVYYAYEALAYHAAGRGHFFARWFGMRIWSAMLLLVAVGATWLLVGELTRRDRLLQLAGAACVGLQPMATFVSASINPDAAQIALWALALWLGVVLLRRPATRGVVAGLVAVTLLALLTKATSLALLPALGLVAVVAGRRELRGRDVRWRRWAPAVAVAGVALLGAGALAARRVDSSLVGGLGDLRGFASYLWQAYLPNLPFQERIEGLAAFAGYDLWVKSAWAAFGWLEVQFHEPVYIVLAAVSGLLLGGGAVAAARGHLAVDRAVAAFLALAVLVLAAGLHWTDYRQFLDQGQSFVQGRYLLPLLPIAGVAAAGAVSLLPRRRRGVAVALLLGGLVTLQLFSLGITVGRFYA